MGPTPGPASGTGRAGRDGVDDEDEGWGVGRRMEGEEGEEEEGEEGRNRGVSTESTEADSTIHLLVQYRVYSK